MQSGCGWCLTNDHLERDCVKIAALKASGLPPAERTSADDAFAALADRMHRFKTGYYAACHHIAHVLNQPIPLAVLEWNPDHRSPPE